MPRTPFPRSLLWPRPADGAFVSGALVSRAPCPVPVPWCPVPLHSVSPSLSIPFIPCPDLVVPMQKDPVSNGWSEDAVARVAFRKRWLEEALERVDAVAAQVGGWGVLTVSRPAVPHAPRPVHRHVCTVPGILFAVHRFPSLRRSCSCSPPSSRRPSAPVRCTAAQAKLQELIRKNRQMLKADPEYVVKLLADRQRAADEEAEQVGTVACAARGPFLVRGCGVKRACVPGVPGCLCGDPTTHGLRCPAHRCLGPRSPARVVALVN